MAAGRARRIVRRLVIALLVAVGFVAVAGVVAVVIALDTSWGRERVRAYAEAQLAAAFVGGATLGELDIGWRGDFTARDIVIRAPDGTTAIAIGALHGRVALAPLIDHEVDCAHVIAEDIAVTVARGSDGAIGIADLLPPGPPSPWRVWLPRVDVHGGSVVVTGFARRPLHVDDVAGEAVVDVPFGGEAFVTGIGTARWRERAAAITVAGTLQHDDGTWRFPVLTGTVGDVGVAAAVATYVSDADGHIPAVSGLFAAAGNHAAIARLGVDVPGDGAIAARVEAPGGPSDERAIVIGTAAGGVARADVVADVVRRRMRGDARLGSAVELGGLPGGAHGRVTGAVAFDLDASGDAPVVAVRGHVSGRGVGYLGGRAGTLELDIDATGLPARPRGRARFALRDVARGSIELDSFDITAATGAGNEVDVSARTRPKNRPWLVEADARVVPGRGTVPTMIDLLRHHLRIEGHDWRGTTGHIEVGGDGGIAVRGFASASRDGSVTLDGEYARGRLRVDTQITVPEVATARARIDVIGRTVRTADVAVDADLGAVAGLLGVQRAPQGHATLRVQVSRPGAVAATFDADVLGVLPHPIALHADAAFDGSGARVDATAADRAGAPALATLHAELAATLAQLVADPRSATTAALSGTLAIPSTPAARVLAELGGTAVIDTALTGTVEGTLAVAGTVAHPTATAKLVARELAAPIPGQPNAPSLAHSITADAAYDGRELRATIVAQGDHGSLRATATAPAEAPNRAAIAVTAEHFEIHPLTAMLPGALAGIAGTLDGKLTATGLDPRTAKLAGALTIKNARIPVAPMLGTLRDATVAIAIADGRANVSIDGKLRAGTVSLRGTLPLADASGHAVIQLHHVSPIASVEPALDAEVTADLRRSDDRYEVALSVQHGVITIPDERNHPLDAVGLPDDFTLGAPPAQPVPPPARKPAGAHPDAKTAAAKPPPSHPTLICTIDLGHTRVVANDLHTEITGKLQISIGEATVHTAGIGIVGQVAAERGDALLFGRRYQIDHAFARFDGATDPLVDARITYDFPEVTTMTELHGRLSKPQLMMSSQPTYSQDELLGFLLGGEPNSDPSQSQSTATQVSSTGMSVVAAKMSGYFRKALPISIDVLDYEQATAQNSAAMRVGTWLTRDLFIAYRRHLDPRPDENESEADSEYWLSSHVSIEAEAGDRDYDGVDLLWRHRW